MSPFTAHHHHHHHLRAVGSMRALSHLPLPVLPRGSALLSPSFLTPCRYLSVAGGARGDLFTRHAGQYKEPYGGAARGIVHLSESTEPQDGQVHIRKRRAHISYERKYSGGAMPQPPIAAWSYLIPSLRTNVEASCPDELYTRLQTEGEAQPLLSPQQQQQLAEAQALFRFELQQRIGLLEDSLAEAELPYLLQWPMLFQRLWLQLPLHTSVSPSITTTVSSAQGSSDTSVVVPAVETSPAPLPTRVWATASSAASPHTKAPPAGSHHPHTSFPARLDRLTAHLVTCVEEELRTLAAAAAAKDDGAPRSRRQVALEASWHAQWASAVRWHTRASA